jgi:hypothetical protein
MFCHANPLTELRKHITTQTDEEANATEWTTPFNNTNTLLKAGLGYSVSVGRVYYEGLDDSGIAGKSPTQKTSVQFNFPKNNTIWQFYNEITKVPIDKTESIQESGRKFSGRFIYEDTISVPGKSIVPTSDILVYVPTNAEGTGETIIVGNPLMAHIDFAKFYEENKNVILPQFKLLKKGNEYISLVASIENGSITGILSSDSNLTLKSIPPMQSFIVTTRADYTGTPENLVITKGMGTVAVGLGLRAAEYEQDVIRISASRSNLSTSAAIALSSSANNDYLLNEDSRRMLIKGVNTAPSIYTIVDGMYLDINRMKMLPESLPIGISTGKTGETTIAISGVQSLSDPYGQLFLRDVEEQLLLPIEDDDFSYTFNNTVGDVIGRFYLVRQESMPVNIETVSSEKISIYKSSESIHVLSVDGSEILELCVYGVDGKTLYKQKNTGQSYIEIPLRQLNTIMAMVKATTTKASAVSKVVVK